MRRGLVEYNHDIKNDCFIFKINPEQLRDENGDLNPSYATSISVKDFVDEYIVDTLNRPADSVEDKIFQLNEWMKETSMESDPYNPKFGESLKAYLETKTLEFVKPNSVSFPVEVSMKWSEKVGKIEFHSEGLDDEIMKVIHAVLDHDPRIESLLVTVMNERHDRTRQVTKMEESQNS